MNRTRIINDWKPETHGLIQTLLKHGLTVVSVDNGENETNFNEVSLDTFVEETMACDEAHLYVRTPENKSKTLFLVYGNEPGELVADYSVCPEIDAATDEHYKHWEGKKQPTEEQNY
jgi:hypothetical protein